LVNTTERRNTLEENSPSSERRRNSEQSNAQKWQERIIFVILSTLRILERQSYLLSIFAMLVKTKKIILIFLRKEVIFLGMEYNIS